MPSTTQTLFAALAGAVSVAAHGHVNNIVINGASYPGFDTFSDPWKNPRPIVVGWDTTVEDNGFVSPKDYGSSDIICHRGAKNAKGHAKVAAGDSIFIQWDTWPVGHVGPVLDYLAPCGDAGCETVSKETLKFFKIDEKGMKSKSPAPGTPGKFATDEVLTNGFGWMVQIPKNVKAGFYVLRHEFIALHSAHQKGGAQNYPQCFNLEITGSGTDQPEGVLGTSLYNAEDPGIDFNVYQDFGEYKIPGPPVIKGGESVEQRTSAIASSATPITGTARSQPDATPYPQPGGNGNEGGEVYVPSTTLATATKPTTTAAPAGGNGSGNGNGYQQPEYTKPPVVNNPEIVAQPTTTAIPTAVAGQEPAATTTAGHVKCKKPKGYARRHASRRHARRNAH
jgi:hypothetical protein